MHAIEFESVIGNHTIPLPSDSVLRPGQSVRVVVMYERLERSSAVSQSKDRLSGLVAHPSAVTDSNVLLPSPWNDAGWNAK